VLQVAAALGVALHHQLNAPLDFRGWALPAAAEILVVFNLQLPDVPFELGQLFVDGRHGWKSPSTIMLGGQSEAVNQGVRSAADWVSTAPAGFRRMHLASASENAPLLA